MTPEQYRDANRIVSDIQRRKTIKEEIAKVQKDLTKNPVNFYGLSVPGNSGVLGFRLPHDVLVQSLQNAQEYLDNDIKRLEDNFKAI